jgi:hypothetical protein
MLECVRGLAREWVAVAAAATATTHHRDRWLLLLP